MNLIQWSTTVLDGLDHFCYAVSFHGVLMTLADYLRLTKPERRTVDEQPTSTSEPHKAR